MATIHKGKNALKTKANNYLLISILLAIAPIVYFVAFIQGFYFKGIFHLFPVMLFWAAIFFWKKYSVLSAGIKGEERTSSILRELPKGYEVFSSVQLSTNEGMAELDHVIVGENGVFVVEVKNHNGTIQGRDEDHSWIQHKVGRKGGEYTKEMRNPVKQVRRQVHILSSYFKQNGINLWIEGAVYFSNPQANVNVTSERTNVFTSSNELQTYLTTHSSKRKINHEVLNKAKALIKR